MTMSMRIVMIRMFFFFYAGYLSPYISLDFASFNEGSP